MPRARATMIIRASAERIYTAFVEPDWLTRYWLSAAAAPLAVGSPVRWAFLVPGAEATTTATRLDPGKAIAWTWDDALTVTIDLEPVEGGTAVAIVVEGFTGSPDEIVSAVADTTEGFALVLADLKTLLETGTSANIVRDKARLIELRG